MQSNRFNNKICSYMKNGIQWYNIFFEIFASLT